MTGGRNIKHTQLRDLQQTVDSLVWQLRAVQLEIQHKKEPFWKTFSPRLESEFMSAVCNKHVRPNIKVMAQADSGRQ